MLVDDAFRKNSGISAAAAARPHSDATVHIAIASARRKPRTRGAPMR